MYAEVSRGMDVERFSKMCLAMVGLAVMPAVTNLAAYFIYIHYGVGAAGMTLTAHNILWLGLKVGGELAAEEIITTETLITVCGLTFLGFGAALA